VPHVNRDYLQASASALNAFFFLFYSFSPENLEIALLKLLQKTDIGNIINSFKISLLKYPEFL
jgi:hypothetical protein